MFCPNCGTKNEDIVEKCAQCGFDLQSSKKTAAQKFKGTMMLQASPFADAKAPAAGGAPAPDPAAAPAAAQPKPAPSMKGTMVGLAPPGMEELRRQMQEAAAKASPSTAVPSAGPASAATPSAATPSAATPSTATPTPSAAPAASSKLKGTMIGVAPPSMADMAKALQAQRDAANAAAQAPSVPPAASTSSHPPADAAPKPASVAMKGTMLGVAPPDVAALSQAMLSKAAAEKAAASAAPAPASAALKGTMLGVAPPDVTELRAKLESERPPAPNNDEDVNAFGGTVVGTSPFFGMNPADEEAARQRLSSASGTGAGGFDPNEATPAEMDGPGAGPSAIAAQYAQRAQERPSNAPDDDLRAPVYRPPGVPGVPARNNAPVILLIGVILVICLLLAAFAL